MHDPMRPFPQASEKALADSGSPVAARPLPSMGSNGVFTFTTLEALVTHFSHWLPPQYVYNLIEAEKEVFVVRRDVSLQETRLQFLKRCENTLVRILLDLQAGRTTLDWSFQPNKTH